MGASFSAQLTVSDPSSLRLLPSVIVMAIDGEDISAQPWGKQSAFSPSEHLSACRVMTPCSRHGVKFECEPCTQGATDDLPRMQAADLWPQPQRALLL